ncbi:hypothetical protein PUN28_014920 [Cardiocondyla obscurior]|uniref:Uncharacterized protein n=1 Tax=Cardiocondyla obscurior TaxID=286306 RepID=A0AAW2EZV7_9HYME
MASVAGDGTRRDGIVIDREARRASRRSKRRFIETRHRSFLRGFSIFTIVCKKYRNFIRLSCKKKNKEGQRTFFTFFRAACMSGFSRWACGLGWCAPRVEILRSQLDDFAINLIASVLPIGAVLGTLSPCPCRSTGSTGSGVRCVLAPMYTAEISEKHIRGTTGVFFQLPFVIGVLYAYRTGFTRDDRRDFQPLLHRDRSCSTPTMVFMPESTLFYLTKNKEEDARKCTRFFRGPVFDIEPEISAFKDESITLHQKLVIEFNRVPAVVIYLEISSSYGQSSKIIGDKIFGINSVVRRVSLRRNGENFRDEITLLYRCNDNGIASDYTCRRIHATTPDHISLLPCPPLCPPRCIYLVPICSANEKKKGKRGREVDPFLIISMLEATTSRESDKDGFDRQNQVSFFFLSCVIHIIIIFLAK